MLKTAITVWEDRISPVYDSASLLWIAEIMDHRIVNKRIESFEPEFPAALISRLKKMGVSCLICGAISETPAESIVSNGIELIPFVAGDAAEVLDQFARGNSLIPRFLMPGRHQTREPEDVSRK